MYTPLFTYPYPKKGRPSSGSPSGGACAQPPLPTAPPGEAPDRHRVGRPPDSAADRTLSESQVPPGEAKGPGPEGSAAVGSWWAEGPWAGGAGTAPVPGASGGWGAEPLETEFPFRIRTLGTRVRVFAPVSTVRGLSESSVDTAILCSVRILGLCPWCPCNLDPIVGEKSWDGK